MAAVDLITVGKLKIIVVDADPSVSGVAANIGSLAMLNTTGKLFYKNGATDTDWTDTIETQTLAQTLALGNTTGGTKIIMSNGDNIEDPTGNIEMDFGQGFGYWAITTDNGAYLQPYVYLDTNSAYMADATHGFFFGNFTAPGVTRFVHVRPAELELKHDTKIEMDAPDVNLPQETASLILSTDASKNIKGLSTVTYPSLAELAFIKGLTSAVQTQIDGKQPLDTQLTEIAALNPANDDVFQEKAGVITNRTPAQLSADLTANLLIGYQGIVIQGGLSNSAIPADSTTYYIGMTRDVLGTGDGTRRIIFPKSGTIIRIDVYVRVAIAGSAENVSYSFRLNSTTDTALGTATWDTQDVSSSFTGLSIAVAAGDFAELKLVTPAWVLNPTSITLGFVWYME